MHRIAQSFIHWFDKYSPANQDEVRRIGWSDVVKALPFITIHAMCIGVLWVSWSWFAVGVAALLYFLRMFAITAFYHRYFSHRSFRTSRVAQFMFALAGSTAAQKGPLWWAAHHRHHHRHSDADEDIHSPHRHGFWWSHVGWIISPRYARTNFSAVRDLVRFRELLFLDRFDWLAPAGLAGGLFLLGHWLETAAPGLKTNGWQLLIWGFGVSTVVLYHGTFSINSLCHLIGRKRFKTTDDSRNSLVLALVTLGEGWHNNHHRYPGSTRQGFYWWQIDISFYLLRALSWIGVVWHLNEVPPHILAQGRSGQLAAE